MKFEGTADCVVTPGPTAAAGDALSARSLPVRGAHGTGPTGVARRRRCLAVDPAPEGLRRDAAGAPARSLGATLENEAFERLAATTRGRLT